VKSPVAVVKKRDETRSFISLLLLDAWRPKGRGLGQIQSDREFYGSKLDVSNRYCPNLGFYPRINATNENPGINGRQTLNFDRDLPPISNNKQRSSNQQSGGTT
jgi:hypothetical protein